MGTAILILATKLSSARAVERQLRESIAKMKAAENMLKEHAYHDYLTGLPNRALLADRFQQAMERSKRSTTPFAIVMIDLNNFKNINDLHGHASGDQVLVEIGKRLLQTVRASDTVARMGGDEFVLVIEALEDRRELARVGQKLIDMLSEIVTLDSGHVVSVGGSLGFAMYPEDGTSLESMLQVADQAMYNCKTSGMVPLF
jgi:diguanylate cyclase (GGDEF)-like protein